MADLRSLNLLRNDPEAAARVVAEADAGDVDAQFAAGLIYAEGRGVDVDLVQAYYWLTRAIDQGDADAELPRRVIAAQMDDGDFTRAKRLVELARDAVVVTDEGTTTHH